MANLSCKVAPGEALELYPAAKAEPYIHYAEDVPGAPVATATADGTGLATFTGITSRIEYVAKRPGNRYVKLMDATTRVQS